MRITDVERGFMLLLMAALFFSMSWFDAHSEPHKATRAYIATVGMAIVLVLGR